MAIGPFISGRNFVGLPGVHITEDAKVSEGVAACDLSCCCVYGVTGRAFDGNPIYWTVEHRNYKQL
jgi:hypothetical protein